MVPSKRKNVTENKQNKNRLKLIGAQFKIKRYCLNTKGTQYTITKRYSNNECENMQLE